MPPRQQPQPGYKPLLSMGPFMGLNTTASEFYLKEGDSPVASNVDIARSRGAFVTSNGRELVGTVALRQGYEIISVTPFTTFSGSADNDGSITEVCLFVFCAYNSTTGDAYAGYLNAETGASDRIATVQPFTSAEQFGDSLYTSGGSRIIFDPNGDPKADEWQVQVDPRLPYAVAGSSNASTGSGGTFQYAYTVRKSAFWRTKGGPAGTQASWQGSVTCAANGFVTFSLVYGGQTFTTQQLQFTRPAKNPNISIAELSAQVAMELVSNINSDPQIGQLVTAYNGTGPNFGSTPSNQFTVLTNEYGSDGNNYSGYLTITNTDHGNQANPSSAQSFTGGNNQSGNLETTLDPDLATYQESSPVLTPNFEVANDGSHTPCFLIPSHVGPNDLISGQTPGGETYYGYLYRSSFLNPTYVGVDYLLNLQQGTDINGHPCFIDPYTDEQIQNNVVLELHSDPPPSVGQVYPGPSISSLTPNGPNGGPPSYFQQSDQKVAFTYPNPAIIAKHQTRMFAFTMYPQQPVKYATDSTWRNRLQLQTQLWYSNYGNPTSFDDVNQLLLVGTEDSPGNYQISSANGTPWSPDSQLCEVPVGLSSTGSVLVVFKRRSTFILFGDSPQEFQQGLREGFDIGLYGADALTPAEGGVFWQADLPLGHYFFNGNSPNMISDDIWESLQTLYDIGEAVNCSSSYGGDHIYYASYPASTNPNSPAYPNGITYCYSTITQKWFSLPYGGVLFDTPANIVQSGIAWPTPAFGDNTWSLAYLRNSVQDLGEPVTATWQTNVTTGERRGVRKVVKDIVLIAPKQQADATVTLYADGNLVAHKTWQLDTDLDLSDPAPYGPWARVETLNPGKAEGYSFYAVLEVTNRSTTENAIVWACDVTYEEKGALQSTAQIDGTYDNVSP